MGLQSLLSKWTPNKTLNNDISLCVFVCVCMFIPHKGLGGPLTAWVHITINTPTHFFLSHSQTLCGCVPNRTQPITWWRSECVCVSVRPWLTLLPKTHTSELSSMTRCYVVCNLACCYGNEECSGVVNAKVCIVRIGVQGNLGCSPRLWGVRAVPWLEIWCGGGGDECGE